MAPRPHGRRAAWFLFAATPGALAACGGSEPAARPDVVLVVIDTLRADRTSAYGYERPTTPFLEHLAAEGTLFEDVTAQSSWTLPSMVSLFSGRYLTDYRDTPDPDMPLLAETFQRAGYRTVGASANILLTEASGFGRGFEHYDARPAPRDSDEHRYVARDFEHLLADTQPALERALGPAEEEQGRQPILLYLQPFDPHGPYEHRPQYEDELPTDDPAALSPMRWQRAVFDEEGGQGPPEDPDWELAWGEIQRMRAYYDHGVRFADDVLARAFEEWREAGLLDHAVVAVVSDHGEGLWEHRSLMHEHERQTFSPLDFFYMDHGANLYSEGTFTPFLLWGAGVPAGLRVETPVENVDLFPTLLELCDVPMLAPLHGRSLVPLLRGRAFEARDALYSFVLHWSGVREPGSDWKLHEPSEIAIQRRGSTPELYELGADPLERSDLSRERADQVERLRGRLERWRERHPTASPVRSAIDAHRDRMLRDLGYTGEHVGRDLDAQ